MTIKKKRGVFVLIVAGILFALVTVGLVFLGPGWNHWSSITLAVGACVCTPAGLFLLFARRRQSSSDHSSPAHSSECPGLRHPSDYAQILDSALRQARDYNEHERKNGDTPRSWQIVLGTPGTDTTPLAQQLADRCRGASDPPATLSDSGIEGCTLAVARHGTVVTIGKNSPSPCDNAGCLLEEIARIHRRLRRTNNGEMIPSVIIVCNAPELQAPCNQRTEYARQLRRHLEQVSDKFGHKIAIYCTISEIEALSGFYEHFQGIEHHRGILGASGANGADRRPNAVREQITRELNQLVRNARANSFPRLCETRNPHIQSRLLGFPEQLSIAIPSIVEFCDILANSNAGSDAVVLRGVFFVSTGSQPSPANWLVQRFATQHEISAQSVAPTSEQLARTGPWFLDEFCHRVLQADRFLRLPTQKARIRRQRMVMGASIGVLAMLAFGAGATRPGIKEQHRLLDELQASNATSLTDRGGAGYHASARLARFTKLHRRWMQLGLRERALLDAELVEQLRRTIALATWRQRIVPLIVSDLEHLQTHRGNDIADKTPLRVRLGRVLLTRSAQESFKELPSDTQVEWLGRALEQGLGLNANSLDAHAIHIFLGEWRHQPDMFDSPAHLTVSPSLVEKTRRFIANADPLPDLLLDLEHTHDARSYRIDFTRITNNPAYKAGQSNVPGFFTRRAWESIVRSQLKTIAQARAAESWILGESKPPNRLRIEEELRAAYLRGYRDHWQNFVEQIRPAKVTDFGGAKAWLRDAGLASPSPLLSLLATLSWNTHLPSAHEVPDVPTPKRLQKAGKVAQQLAQHLPRSSRYGTADLRLHFQGLTDFALAGPLHDGPDPTSPEAAPLTAGPQLMRFQNHLNEILDNLRDHRDPTPEKSPQLIRSANMAATKVRDLVHAQPQQWRKLLGSWLVEPIEALASTAARKKRTRLSSAWCSRTWAPIRNGLLTRYPFVPSKSDVESSVFAALLQPKSGRLAQFLEQYFNGADGSLNEESTIGGEAVTTNALRFLRQAQLLGDWHFDKGTNNPALYLEFRISSDVPDLALQLNIGGQTFESVPGDPSWHKLKWEIRNSRNRSSIIAHGREGGARLHSQGPWSLFRLLDQGRANLAAGGEAISVTWDLQTRIGGHIVMEIRSSSPELTEALVHNAPLGLRGPYVELAKHKVQRLSSGMPNCAP